MRNEMEVQKVDRADRGSCNFCSHVNKYRKVYEVRAPQPGGLIVRFCKECLDNLNSQVKECDR